MDLNTLLSIAPKIVLFLLFFLSIALFFEFFYLKKKKKEKVLTPQAIPELPKENTGTAKFATSYKAAAVKKKLNVNKKVLLSLILVGVTTVSGLSVYLATRPQPQTTTSKASSEQPFRVNAIHERIGNTLRAGGLFYILGVPLTLTPTTSQEPPTPTPCVPRNGVPCPESPDLGSTNDSNTNATINITLNIRKFHCENNEPNPQGCAENETNETRTGSIEPGRPNIELVGLINMNQCGQYQIDTDYTAIDTSTGNTYRGEAGAITGFTTSCNIEPTGRPTRTPTPIPPPGATNTPIPTNTSIPTPTRATTTPPP
ncbi:MAG TPA: hypothetical protein VK338_01460, partial [Candidatus Nitrosocosmicus sp.]|nr:hypothetical protein [Candidatus Nitrosocosmicus sp.]